MSARMHLVIRRGRYARRMPRQLQPVSPFCQFSSSPEVIGLVVLMYVRFLLLMRNVKDAL